MKEAFKFLGIAIGATVVVIGVIYIILAVMFGDFSPTYNKKDLINNYNKHSKEILEIKRYIGTITDAQHSVDIEYKNNSELEIFHVIKYGGYNSNWNIDVASPKADTLLAELGWTKETLKTLKEKLDDADCISVQNGDPVTIGYKRSGMGIYFYKIFNNLISDSTKKKYNDGCMYSYYEDKVVLEYGGGAIGSQCFEDYKYKQK
jgi:hypothetical protein